MICYELLNIKLFKLLLGTIFIKFETFSAVLFFWWIALPNKYFFIDNG